MRVYDKEWGTSLLLLEYTPSRPIVKELLPALIHTEESPQDEQGAVSTDDFEPAKSNHEGIPKTGGF